MLCWYRDLYADGTAYLMLYKTAGPGEATENHFTFASGGGCHHARGVRIWAGVRRGKQKLAGAITDWPKGQAATPFLRVCDPGERRPLLPTVSEFILESQPLSFLQGYRLERDSAAGSRRLSSEHRVAKQADAAGRLPP